MTDSQVLVSTRATVPTAAGASLDVEFRKAQALAKAGNLLPSAYRNNPGAIILIQQWANARGIDTVTAIQTVSFIDGRPVVDATMQRAMAEREGVRVKVTEATRESATVEMYRGDELLGSTTYTMDDARAAGLDGKRNWKQNPVDMLVARATTRGLRWHAPSVMLGTFTEDEAEQASDVLTIAAVPVDHPDGPGLIDGGNAVETVGGSTPPAATEIVDAEVIETEAVNPEAPTDPLTVAELRDLVKLAGKTQRETIEHAQEITDGEKPGSLQAILDGPACAPVLAWLSTAANERTAADPFGGEQ